MGKTSAVTSLIILICLPVSCTLNPGVQPRAFVISIGLDYSQTAVNTLIGTENDALETAVCLATLYGKRGIECHVRVINSCTSSDISDFLSGLELCENDFLVFYWSGHGHTDENGMFLVAYPEGDDLYSPFYVSDLTAFTEKLPCPSVILLDCCYAGCAAENFSISIPPAGSLEKSAVIASCAGDELSLMTHVRTEEGLFQAHSVFTAVLLEELGWIHSLETTTGAGSLTAEGYVGTDPGRLSVSELGIRIRNNIGEDSQHPVFDRTALPVFIVP